MDQIENEELAQYLKPGHFVNSADPDIIAFAKEVAGDTGSDTERVLKLFHVIRDDILYDPYMPMGIESSYTATDCLAQRRGWCVPKAALLAACARAIGVPARPGYADVLNHLATDKLIESMGGCEVFFWHSYCDLYLDGKWVKATPAFNKSMCEKFGLLPLEFDGKNDSLFHEFDKAGNKHMEYVQDRGPFFDVPFKEITDTFMKEYNGMNGQMGDGIDGDFQVEAGA